MKKNILNLLAVASLIFSTSACNSDDSDSREVIIEVAELPEQSRNFLETNFNGFQVNRATKDVSSFDEYYEIFVNNGITIDFNRIGEWTEVDGNGLSIPTSFIDEEIVSYINTNFPTFPIENIDKKPYGYEVDLINNTELRFNTSGKLIGY
mgnify:FL=1